MDNATFKKCSLLYRFEWKKLLKGWQIYFCIGILLTVIIVSALNFKEHPNGILGMGTIDFGDNWREQIQDIWNSQTGNPRAILQWYIDNNIKPPSSRSASNFLISENVLLFIISMVVVAYIACRVIATDISNPTSVYLNGLPLKRYQVLITKIVFVLSLMIVLSIVVFLLNIVVSQFVFGFDRFSSPFLESNGGVVTSITYAFPKIFNIFLLTTLFFIFIALFSVLASIVIGYEVPATVFSVIVVYVVVAVCQYYISAKSWHWMEFLPFIHINIVSRYINPGNFSFNDLKYTSLGFSIGMMFAWSAIFVAASLWLNKSRLKKTPANNLVSNNTVLNNIEISNNVSLSNDAVASNIQIDSSNHSGTTSQADTICIKKLYKTFRKRVALNNVDLSLGENQVVGLLGQNGAGKTTLLKSIMGRLNCKFETIDIGGHCIKYDYAKAMQDIVFMSDHNIFYKHLSGYDNLKFLADIYKKPKDEILKIVEQVNLSDRIYDNVSQYSLGMCQRLSLARCILISPKVIIMDEPFNGIDIIGVHFMKQIITKLSKENNISFLISSHNVSELQEICTRFLIINHGNIIHDTPSDGVDIEQIYLQKVAGIESFASL